MKRTIRDISILVALLTASLILQAQQLDVEVKNVGYNKIQLIATATGAGFATSPDNVWGDMNITWRIPKSVAVPAPTPPPAPPALPTATPEVTGETTAFTGAAPQDGFTHSLELAIFDVTTFGGTDDGYWYFQVTGTANNVQNIASGGSMVVYEFNVPVQWTCASCVEILTSDVPELLDLGGISTTSFIQNAGLNTDVLNIVANMGPLPVTWQSVKAEARENRYIQVQWVTASEHNNAGFEVERSEDGGGSWRSLGKVAARGNSNEPSYYSFHDEQVVAGVKYHYRIKQTDLDGRARYSTIVLGVLQGGNYFTLAVKPNPVRDQLYLEIQSPKKQTAQVVITDITGKLYRIERNVKLETSTTRYSCIVAGYPAGTYVAKVIAEDGTVQAMKFIIGR